MIRPPDRLLAPVTALTLVLASPAASPAQSGWAVELSAGRANYDPIAAAVSASNLSAGLRYFGDPGWFYVSAGTPLGSEGARWWAGGLGGRYQIAVGPARIGADLGAHLFGYADIGSSLSGTGATLQAVPVFLAERGPWAVELGSGVVRYQDRGDTTVTRTIHDSGLRISLDSRIPLTVSAEGRLLRAPEGDYPFAGGGAEYEYGDATLWASAGTWLSEDITLAAVSAGVALGLDDRTAVRLEWQQEPTDPLYWSSPRRTWSVGLSRALGARAPTRPLFPVQENGRVIIRIPLETSASAPSIVGDFTGWEPVPMTRDGDYWMIDLAVESGTYYYGFQNGDGDWFIPPSIPHQVDDGMGGKTAVLVVA